MAIKDVAKRLAAGASVALATSGLSSCKDGGGTVVDPPPPPLQCSLAALGQTLGTIRQIPLRQALISVLAYIAWGFFQQYLLNAFFVNRLAAFAGEKRPHDVALAAAVLFSLVHLPNWFLMPVTLVGGYLSARVYLRYRSLYVLGLAHGILGFLLFLVVPDSISAHFLIGPRYLINVYGTYPELLL